MFVECYDIDPRLLPDSSFEASSSSGAGYLPHFARLSGNKNGWAPKKKDLDSGTAFLQVDLGAIYSLCSIKTKGNKIGREWLTSYKVDLSFDGKEKSWFYYQEKSGTNKVIKVLRPLKSNYSNPKRESSCMFHMAVIMHI